MWIFTKDGYLSIVEYSPHFVLPKTRKEAYQKLTSEEKRLGKNYKPACSTRLSSHLLVRARVDADLNPLVKLAEERNTIVLRHTDKSADYHYRAVVDRNVVGEYLLDQVVKLDYNSHVKEVISSNAPPVEGNLSRHSGMFDIWDATSRWQKSAPYSGANWTNRKWSTSKKNDGKLSPPVGYLSWDEYFAEKDAKRPKNKSLLDSVIEKKNKDGSWKPAKHGVLPLGSGSWKPAKQGALPLGSVTEDGELIVPVKPVETPFEPMSDQWMEENPLADPRDLEWFNKQQQEQLDLDRDKFGADAHEMGHWDDTDMFHPAGDPDDLSVLPGDTRAHNEYLATLVMDALVENYGNVPISEIPEDEIAREFRRVLMDEALQDDLN